MIFLNSNGIGKFKDSTRWEEIKGFMKHHQVDAVGLSELNIDWRTSSVENSMFGRTQGCFPTRPALSVAHNTSEPKRSTANQRGGTAVIATDKLSICKESVGQDNEHLGRWSWVRVKGKNDIHTRVVSVYFPNDPGSPTDRGTYNQQRDHFLKIGITTCPKVQFWIDFKKELQSWLADGDQLVIGGDWNLHMKKVNEHLAPFGLTEAITSAHGIDNAPNTYIRGSEPIDGIFTTASLKGVNCGYLPFYKGTTSDHRIIWIDFDFDSVLGYQMEDLKLPQARRLLLKDPRVWKRYNHLLDKWETKHKLLKRAKDLLAESSYPITEEVHRKLEAIDHLRVQGMIYAEKRCRKIRRGYYPWSPEFARARSMVKLYAMMRDRRKFGSIGARTILRLLARLGITVDLEMPIEEIEAELSKARKAYAEVKKKASELRVSYLRELAKALADNEQHKIASKLRMLIHIEEQRRIARAIKYTTGKLFSHGTSRVIVPDENGVNCEVTGRVDLEREIIRENIRKYHMTEGYCPLLRGQLLEDIGLCGEGPRVEDILNGTYVCPEGTPKGTRLFIESMKRPKHTRRSKERATRSSVEEFKYAWKRRKESSSSCGQLHYGHYKAACKNDKLSLLHYTMAEIFITTGCYLSRHRTGIDVMLLKLAGDYRLHRLRTICLFDAEYNMNNDRVSKNGLGSALELGEIAPEQYSRPCSSAIDHVVNRRLSFEYFAYMKLPFGLCSCDLAGCYDRIVHSAASLALQRLGVPLARIHGMFDTIQRLVKKVRTAFGDSEMTYGGDYVEWPFIAPPQGVYQGNCNGPPVWSIISSTVFSVLRKQGFGVKFITSLSEEIFHLCGFAYVDDTDLLQSGNSTASVAKDLQDALTLWADVLAATGQALAPKKSWWYLIDMVWEKGSWKYTDGGECSDLIAFDTAGNEVSLKRLIHSEGTKMLGVYLAPDGNKAKQFEYLKTKANEWADCIRVGHLGKLETRIALTSCIWKTLLYPMPVTTFTEQELNSIIWPILDAALPRIGICRNIAMALRYGPKRLGGMGLINLLLDQGIQKIQSIVDHTWKRTPTGDLINANTQALSLDCGVVGNIFEQSSTPLTWSTIPDTWIGHAWAFASARDIEIRNLPIKSIPLQRANDSAIMTHIRSVLPDLTNRDMQKINVCRLFLKAVTISDLTDAGGRVLCGDIFHTSSIPAKPRFGHNYRWPRQPLPPTSFWTLWKRSITRAYCFGDSLALDTPLGDWLHELSPTFSDWDWFCHTNATGIPMGLWHCDGGTWFLHRRIPHRSRRLCHFQVTGIPSISVISNYSRLTRVCVRHSSVSISIFSISRFPVRFSQPSIPPGIEGFSIQDSFLHFISTLKESEWLLRYFSFSGDLSKLLHDFCNGDLLCVSDGSFSIYRKCGGSAWVLESVDRSAKIRGDCLVPGKADDQNAYRAELCGVFGITASLWALYHTAKCRAKCLQNCDDIVLGCDGYSALQKSLIGVMERLTCKHKHYDLLGAIRGIWRELPFQPFPTHIEGHKDEYYPYYALTRLEKMNVDMDAEAKRKLSSYSGNADAVPYGDFTFGLPVIYHRGDMIVTEANKTLLDRCTRDDLLAYWQRVWRLSNFEFHKLALPPFERAMASTSDTKRTFITKWLSRQVNLGTRTMLQSTKRKHSQPQLFRCPRCNHWKDDIDHVFRCPRAASIVKLHLDSWKEWMENNKSDPALVSGILLCTKHWLDKSRIRPSVFLSQLPHAVADALSDQYIFGWDRFMQGLHLSSITFVQEDYFYSIRSHRSADKWHGLLIQEIWKLGDALFSARQDAINAKHDRCDPDHPAIPLAQLTAVNELQLGYGALPPLYHSFFRVSPDNLRSKTPEDLRKWLFVVRLNREAVKDPLLITDDDFSPNGKYRAWLVQ